MSPRASLLAAFVTLFCFASNGSAIADPIDDLANPVVSELNNNGVPTDPVALLVAQGIPVYAIHVYDDGTIAVDAETSYSDCASGWLCLWRDADYKGKMWQFQSSGSWQNLNSYGASDEVSSWRNRRGLDAQLSWDVNGGGSKICLDSGAASSGLGGWNDEASALRITNSSSYC